MFVQREGIFYDMRLTLHARQRLAKRKIPVARVREVIQKGRKVEYPQTIQFFYAGLKVVVSALDNKIMTVYPLKRG